MILNGMALTEYMIVFVRVAACIMVLPGFSMTQVAVQIRLFVAIGISISIYMLVANEIHVESNLSAAELGQLIFSEIFIALAFAIPVRFLFLSLSFLGEVIMQFIGLNPIPGTPIGDDQATTTLSSLFNITAVVLFFSTGMVMDFMAALAQSFIVFPPGEILYAGDVVDSFVKSLNSFFNIVIRLGAPIIIYAIIMNLIAGLVNKLTPQIPVYFVSTPFLITGGLVLLIWTSDDILFLFNMELGRLLSDLL